MSETEIRNNHYSWICALTCDGKPIWVRMDRIVYIRETSPTYTDVRLIDGETIRLRCSLKTLDAVVFGEEETEESDED